MRVRASSVNPVDAFIAGGVLKGMVEHEFPVVLGRDYAGVVEQAGSAVTGYAVGDEVFGFLLHAGPDGARRHLGRADRWSPRTGRWPGGRRRRTSAAAGAAPLAAITALAAHDALDLGRGATVLVVGASGGVGSFAVQLAAAAGATVLAPGLPEDHDYLRGLGAAEVLDRNGDVAAQVRERYPDGVDALADFASGSPDELNAYAAVVRDGGRIASSAGAAGKAGPNHRRRRDRRREPGAPGRAAGGRHPDGAIQASYPLAQADQALKDLTGQHTQGKLAITLP